MRNKECKTNDKANTEQVSTISNRPMMGQGRSQDYENRNKGMGHNKQKHMEEGPKKKSSDLLAGNRDTHQLGHFVPVTIISWITPQMRFSLNLGTDSVFYFFFKDAPLH